MESKGKNTTIAAFVGLLAILAVIGMFLSGKIDTQQLTVALAAVGAAISTVVGFLSKDANKSHSFETKADDTTNPTKPGGPKT